jgi:hypothetical protein
MSIFWAALAAYIVGWMICNIFLFQIADRQRERESKRRESCRLIAEEYWKLTHTPPPPAVGDDPNVI